MLLWPVVLSLIYYKLIKRSFWLISLIGRLFVTRSIPSSTVREEGGSEKTKPDLWLHLERAPTDGRTFICRGHCMRMAGLPGGRALNNNVERSPRQRGSMSADVFNINTVTALIIILVKTWLLQLKFLLWSQIICTSSCTFHLFHDSNCY